MIKALRCANHHAEVSDLIQLPNGALISSSSDKSVSVWEEKAKAGACGNAACCGIF